MHGIYTDGGSVLTLLLLGESLLCSDVFLQPCVHDLVLALHPAGTATDSFVAALGDNHFHLLLRFLPGCLAQQLGNRLRLVPLTDALFLSQESRLLAQLLQPLSGLVFLASLRFENLLDGPGIDCAHLFLDGRRGLLGDWPVRTAVLVLVL